MITFGYGDGGGGPIRKDLEYYDVLKRAFREYRALKWNLPAHSLSELKREPKKSENSLLARRTVS